MMSTNGHIVILKSDDVEKRRLVTVIDGDFDGSNYFGEQLCEAAKTVGIRKNEIASNIGKSFAQMTKYCDGQGLPSLPDLRKICIMLNTDPMKLMGLEWVDSREFPEPGVIYDWAFVNVSSMQNRLEWKCSLCSKDNIAYEVSELGMMIEPNLTCEFCNNVFHKINEAVRKVSQYERQIRHDKLDSNRKKATGKKPKITRKND